MIRLLTGLTNLFLAQDIDTLHSLRRGLVRRSETDHTWLWWVFGVGLALIVLNLTRKLVSRWRSPRAQVERNYFHDALRVLELDPSERADLERLAQRSRHPEPTAMLLSPGNLSRAYEEALASGEEEDLHLRRRLEKLAVRLYGRPLPVPREPGVIA